MKNLRKFTAMFLLLTTVCLLFSSCASLDELKERHAIYTDETHQTISYQGHLYHKYESEDLDLNSINFTLSGTVLVTEPDVPVLVAGRHGDDLSIDRNKLLISGYIYSYPDSYSSLGPEPTTYENEDIEAATETEISKDDFDSEDHYSDHGRVYYIREDVYDELAETLSTLTLDYFCYPAYTEEGWALMDDQTMASLKHDIYLGNEVYGPDYADSLYENGYYFENSAEIFRCTKDMMISEYFGQITELGSPKGNILFIEICLDSKESMPVCIVLSHPELYRNVLQPYETVYEESFN